MKKITRGENLIAQLEAAGYEAYYVGGCVRDAVMDREGGDIDITTSATPEEVEAVFADRTVIETGIRHGTVTVLDGGIPFEITTFRTEGSYSDNRHPDSVHFVRDLTEDLQRRDFTINAIAMDIRGQLFDPFGGLQDIEAGIIRTVGEADTRFREDALRIMRAMRFAAVLTDGDAKAFRIEEKTSEAMFRNKELLKNVSAERIFVELKKLVVGKNAGNVVRQYIDILGVVIPQMLPMKGFDQRNPYHRYDVLEHCIRAMEHVATQPENATYMKLTALLHDVGKPDTFFIGEDGIGHMYGHPARGEEIVREIMKQLKADRFTTERIAFLVKYHDLVFQLDDKLLKKWMNKYGAEPLLEILQIKRADNIATGNMSRELVEKFDRIEKSMKAIVKAQECFSLKDLAIDGKDVLLLGLEKNKKEGPWVGEVLDMVLEEVIDGIVANERPALLERARLIIDQS